MKCITQDELFIDGAIKSNQILDLKIMVTANDHATAQITIKSKPDSALTYCINDPKQNVSVWAKKLRLFVGIIDDITYKQDGKDSVAVIKLLSLSKLLDQKKEKKSFQDTSKTIQGVIGEIVSEESATVQFHTDDQGISKPVIQYCETAWEFARRMTSRLGSFIFPKETSNHPSIVIGMESKSPGKMEVIRYSTNLSSHYYSNEFQWALTNKSQFMFYEVETYEDHNLGDLVMFQKRGLFICKKEVFVTQSEVRFRYALGQEKMLCLRRYDNMRFAGLTILGKVLESSSETVKLHLEIDKSQSKESAYPYEWTPETGNTMYCMPKKGTQVTLYFGNEKEESAIATSAIRENAGSCKQVQNVNDRYLTTENNKQLYLKPDKMGLVTEEAGLELMMDDAAGLSMQSKKDIILVAQKKISISAKEIAINTPKEIDILQG